MQKVLVKTDPTFIEKLVMNKWFWIPIICFLFFYPVYRSVNRVLPPPLPKISKLPSFSFKNQFGQKFGSEELRGKAYVASFFFSSCPTVCPEIMEAMKHIQHRTRGVRSVFKLVSFTVDPEVDTPKHLFKYSRKIGASSLAWSFLTGDEDKTKDLLIGGFKVAVGEKDSKDVNVYDIVHSMKLVLVDKEGYVRKYYSTDKDSINTLMVDVGLLVNRE
jgi:protein SCO1/2